MRTSHELEMDGKGQKASLGSGPGERITAGKSVTGLWIGKSLPPLAELCVRSFLDHGFHFRLFTYGKVENIPDGTEIQDANTILSEEEAFLHQTGSYTPAADWFRYRLLNDHGGIWVDMDFACLKPFEIDGSPWFALESPSIAAVGMVAFPVGHPLTAAMSELCADPAVPMPWDTPEQLVAKEQLRRSIPWLQDRRRLSPWGIAGPSEFTRAANYYGLMERAAPPCSVYPIHYGVWRHAYDGTYTLDSPFLADSWAVHLWGELVRREPDALQGLSPTSLVAALIARHGVTSVMGLPAAEPEVSSGSARILVSICSARHHVARRQAVRDTWAASKPAGIETCFFVGVGDQLPDEPDTIVVEASDDYDHLPAKVKAFFAASLERDFDWLFKCDDDTYVALDRLREIAYDNHDLVGNDFLESRGSPSGGAGYLLSRRFVELLAADGTLASTGPEDVIVGEAASRQGAAMRATRRLCWDSSRYPRPDNDVITSHWCSPERLRTIHEILSGEALEVQVSHPDWQDNLKLFPGGAFTRCSTACSGRWTQDEKGVVRLHWFDWPSESLVPASETNAVSFEALVERGVRQFHCKRTTVECIVVELGGGIGNQMFQYAHGLALATRINAELKLSFADYGRPFGLDNFGLLLDTDCPSDCDLVEYTGGYRDDSDWPTYEALPKSNSRNVKLWGYFQNENFFRPVEEEIRGKFRLNSQLPEECGNRTPVCIHVRRGDFVGSPLHDICRPAYFLDAIRMMRALVETPFFVVLSDDPEWCREQFDGLSDLKVFNVPEEKEALQIMYACRAFILSNSTFGWWGAWMARARPVIAPNRFLAERSWNICPEDWILIPPTGACNHSEDGAFAKLQMVPQENHT